MGLFISCDQATTICDKNQYGEASFVEKFKLKIHFLICKVCALYSKQNTLISSLCGKHLKAERKEQIEALSEQEKKKIKQLLS